MPPTLGRREEDRTWFANWLRVGATPAVAYALNRAFFETDLRDVLPAVRVPTLALYPDQGADDAPTSRPASRTRSRCDSQATTTSASSSHPKSPTRRNVPCGGKATRPYPRASCSRSSSPTSSGDRARGASATRLGGTPSTGTIRSCVVSSRASVARSATRQATASSRPSTVRRERSAARSRSSTACRRSD